MKRYVLGMLIVIICMTITTMYGCASKKIDPTQDPAFRCGRTYGDRTLIDVEPFNDTCAKPDWFYHPGENAEAGMMTGFSLKDMGRGVIDAQMHAAELIFLKNEVHGKVLYERARTELGWAKNDTDFGHIINDAQKFFSELIVKQFVEKDKYIENYQTDKGKLERDIYVWVSYSENAIQSVEKMTLDQLRAKNNNDRAQQLLDKLQDMQGW